MKTPYSSKGIDHLGLIAGMCQELEIAKFFDNALPEQSGQKHISCGQLVVAMLLNGLGFVGRTLHMYPDYFEERPVERLIGEGIRASHINDDALGRCLDQLYETGVSELYQGISERVVQHLGLPCEGINLDSTSIHVDGRYEREDTDENAVRLVRGYSRDHRPELNQVVLNLITENQAGIPVYMQPANGNSVDTEGFKKIVKAHIGSLKAAQASRYFIADTALYVAETIQSLDEQKQLFISRVSQKISQAKQLIKMHNNYQFEPLENGYRGVWVDSDYAGVKQRWLLLHSEQAEKRTHHTLNKTLLKSSTASYKDFKKLCKRRFGCEQDAKKSLKEWEQSQDYVRISDQKIITHEVYAKSGRPKLGEVPLRLEYQVAGQLYCELAKKESVAAQKGFFILATNDCSTDVSMEKLLSLYKSQQSVEKGFRFLKSPDFLTSSLYLKKPERIEALLMIMTCCLMVYAALEHKIRHELKAKALYFPDMKKKPGQKPTARWVFFCFQGIHELTVEGEQKLVLNLQERNQTIIDCLGDIYRQIYS
jgi:transposase